MSDDLWQNRFREIYSEVEQQYRSGARGPAACLSAQNIEALAKIGYRPQELYDFVDDFIRYGEPSFETALALAGIRRDYFLTVQHGKWEDELPHSSLPPKNAEMEGIVWLPRLIEKARRKLRGQMDDDLMYGCAGDRGFFRRTGIRAEDFLKQARLAGDDKKPLIRFVQANQTKK